MKIIDRIDFNYFRSIGSISLGKCNDINIITGPNDAGKSNLLKAMNLFFNNTPERDEEFEFMRDLNRGREDEARAAKGRMTIWVKVHFNNFLKWKSLPNKFFVKRSWNRYDERPTDSYSDGLPPTTIGRFLNKLQFHYIPAVRGRELYGDLLADLHDTLVLDESAGLRGSSQAFVADLESITGAMSAQIKDRLKIDSRVNIPGDLQDFFRALDFSTKFNDFDVPLPMRGDGIQGRHIPFILDYISSKSNHFHIWGYEEPENSLELSRAYEMADDFKDRFSIENQLFLTTHSPAFYDISGPNVARWFVEPLGAEGSLAPVAQPISDIDHVDESLGLVALIAPRVRQLHNEHAELKSSVNAMSVRISEFESPVVFVEGPTDALILAHARDALGISDLDCRFESANGANEITAFLKVSTRVKPDSRPLIGGYDADAKGREEFDKCKSVHKVENTDIRILDKKKRIYAGILSVPAHLKSAEDHFRSLKVGLPLPIEFMFSKPTLTEAEAAGILVLKSRTARVANHELPFTVKIDEMPGIEEEFRYLCKEVDDDCKTAFAAWVVGRPNECFEPFRKCLEDIRLALA